MSVIGVIIKNKPNFNPISIEQFTDKYVSSCIAATRYTSLNIKTRIDNSANPEYILLSRNVEEIFVDLVEAVTRYNELTQEIYDDL